MQNLILGSWAMISCLVIRAQVVVTPMAAPYPSMTAYSRSFSDAFSAVSQPASLVSLREPSVTVYGERRFLLAELGHYVIAGGWPVGSGCFGVVADYSGAAPASRSRVSLAYARKLGKVPSLGLRLNYHSLRVAGYGAAASPSVDAGIRLQVTDNLQAGISLLQVRMWRAGKRSDPVARQVMQAGMGYDVSHKFLLSASVEKEEGQPAGLLLGFLYRVWKELEFRAGLVTSTSTLWAGAGIRVSDAWLHLVSQYHPQLGFTPGISLSYGPKDKRP